LSTDIFDDVTIKSQFQIRKSKGIRTVNLDAFVFNIQTKNRSVFLVLNKK